MLNYDILIQGVYTFIQQQFVELFMCQALDYIHVCILLCDISLSLGILFICSGKYSEHWYHWWGLWKVFIISFMYFYIDRSTSSPSKTVAYSLQIIILTQVNEIYSKLW